MMKQHETQVGETEWEISSPMMCHYDNRLGTSICDLIIAPCPCWALEMETERMRSFRILVEKTEYGQTKLELQVEQKRTALKDELK